MADRVAAPENPWSAHAAMDEGSSPWDDVPSRSHSSQNLAQAGNNGEGNAENTAPAPAPSSSPPPPVTSRPTPSKTRGPGPRRHNVNLAQSTTLESLDNDSMGPLGPLGAEPPAPAPEPEVAAPTPPVKELANRTRAGSRPNQPSGGPVAGSIRHADAGEPRPPHQPVEVAAKPSFTITVGDPHTVGNAASSHTVYSVITRTTSRAYNNTTSTFTVTRRYRDFLWLYDRLHDNSPGTIVAPPPDKQAVGRFQADFVESRRMALERMLNKIAAHPVLQHDGDLKTFLESDTFNVDIKHKDRSKDPLLGLDTKPGAGSTFMSSIGLGSSTTSSTSSGKFIEHDDWFHDRRVYLDALETQLKTLQKSTEAVITQRKALAETCADFSTSLTALAAVELSPALSEALDALATIQTRAAELYSRQALQDILTLGTVLDEYIRLISSITKAFSQRQRAYHAWHSSESRLAEIKKQQDKLLRAGRSQQDRLTQMEAEVGEAEKRVHAARLLFEDLGRVMRGELERFEREKVEDFKGGVETFLEGAVEAQKELIELWETFLYQLDTDEDGLQPPPSGVAAGDAAGAAGTVSDTAELAEGAGGEAIADGGVQAGGLGGGIAGKADEEEGREEMGGEGFEGTGRSSSGEPGEAGGVGEEGEREGA